MRKPRFSDFMREIEAEAKAEGRHATEQLATFREYFRLAAEMIEARRAKGLPQQQPAKRSGVHQSEISEIIKRARVKRHIL